MRHRALLACLTAITVAVLVHLLAPASTATTFATAGWADRSIVLVDNTPRGWDVPEAASLWNAAGTPLTLSVVKGKDCSRVTGSCILVRTGRISSVGLAQGDYDGPGPITRCTVTLSDSWYRGKTLAFYDQVIIQHEVGHCVGLAHAPSGTDSIMVPDASAAPRTLRPYDLADLRVIYP